jgi:hypothetical protein
MNAAAKWLEDTYKDKDHGDGLAGYLKSQEERLNSGKISQTAYNNDMKRLGQNSRITLDNKGNENITIADTANDAGLDIDGNKIISIGLLGLGLMALVKIVFRRK